MIKEEYDEDLKISIIKDEDYNEDSFRYPGNTKCDNSSQHQQTTSTFGFYGFTLHLGNPQSCSRAFVILSSKARWKSSTHQDCCYFTNAVTHVVHVMHPMVLFIMVLTPGRHQRRHRALLLFHPRQSFMKGTHRCHSFVLGRVIGVMRMVFTIWNDNSSMG